MTAHLLPTPLPEIVFITRDHASVRVFQREHVFVARANPWCGLIAGRFRAEQTLRIIVDLYVHLRSGRPFPGHIMIGADPNACIRLWTTNGRLVKASFISGLVVAKIRAGVAVGYRTEGSIV